MYVFLFFSFDILFKAPSPNNMIPEKEVNIKIIQALRQQRTSLEAGHALEMEKLRRQMVKINI